MKDNRIVMFSAIGIIFAVILIGAGYLDLFPPIGPSPPGECPTVTYKTTVRLDEPFWSLQPHIEWMRTEQTGQQYSTSSELYSSLASGPRSGEVINPLALPWEGTLELTVAYPGGQMNKLTKNVKVEWSSHQEVEFYWQTKQTGDHTLTATLVNGDGVQIDSSSETVSRGTC